MFQFELHTCKNGQIPVCFDMKPNLYLNLVEVVIYFLPNKKKIQKIQENV
jgi:hypothetical protein